MIAVLRQGSLNEDQKLASINEMQFSQFIGDFLSVWNSQKTLLLNKFRREIKKMFSLLPNKFYRQKSFLVQRNTFWTPVSAFFYWCLNLWNSQKFVEVFAVLCLPFLNSYLSLQKKMSVDICGWIWCQCHFASFLLYGFVFSPYCCICKEIQRMSHVKH